MVYYTECGKGVENSVCSVEIVEKSCIVLSFADIIIVIMY